MEFGRESQLEFTAGLNNALQEEKSATPIKKYFALKEDEISFIDSLLNGPLSNTETTFRVGPAVTSHTIRECDCIQIRGSIRQFNEWFTQTKDKVLLSNNPFRNLPRGKCL